MGRQMLKSDDNVFNPLSTDDVNEIYSRQYVTVKQAAALLGTTQQNISYLVGKERIKATYSGGRCYLDTGEFRAYATDFKKELLDRATRIQLPTI